MGKYLFWFLVIVVGATFLLPGDDYPDFRYKITVYARGEAFSSVRQVRVKKVLSIVDSGGSTVKGRAYGQAVMIDLGDQTYFALLNKPGDPEYARYVAGWALGPAIPDTVPPSRRLTAMTEVKGEIDLPRTVPNRDKYRGPRHFETWPTFVTFGDRQVPKSVREVTPEDIGVERITIAITDEPVSEGIDAVLPDTLFTRWADEHKEAVRRRGGFMNPGDNSYFESLTGRLNKGDFVVREE